MEENNQNPKEKRSIKITGTQFVGTALIIIALLVIIAMVRIQKVNNAIDDVKTDIATIAKNSEGKVDLNDEKIVKFQKDAKYSSEYFEQIISFPTGMPEEGMNNFKRDGVLMTYEEYQAFCKQFSTTQDYKDSEKKYVVYSTVAPGVEKLDIQIPYYVEKEGIATVYFHESTSGESKSNPACLIVIPVSKSVNEVNMIELQEQDDYLYTYVSGK